MRQIMHRLHADRLAGDCLPSDSRFGVKVSLTLQEPRVDRDAPRIWLETKKPTLLVNSFLDGRPTADVPVENQSEFGQGEKRPAPVRAVEFMDCSDVDCDFLRSRSQTGKEVSTTVFNTVSSGAVTFTQSFFLGSERADFNKRPKICFPLGALEWLADEWNSAVLLASRTVCEVVEIDESYKIAGVRRQCVNRG